MTNKQTTRKRGESVIHGTSINSTNPPSNTASISKNAISKAERKRAKSARKRARKAEEKARKAEEARLGTPDFGKPKPQSVPGREDPLTRAQRRKENAIEGRETRKQKKEKARLQKELKELRKEANAPKMTQKTTRRQLSLYNPMPQMQTKPQQKSTYEDKVEMIMRPIMAQNAGNRPRRISHDTRMEEDREILSHKWAELVPPSTYENLEVWKSMIWAIVQIQQGNIDGACTLVEDCLGHIRLQLRKWLAYTLQCISTSQDLRHPMRMIDHICAQASSKTQCFVEYVTTCDFMDDADEIAHVRALRTEARLFSPEYVAIKLRETLGELRWICSAKKDLHTQGMANLSKDNFFISLQSLLPTHSLGQARTWFEWFKRSACREVIIESLKMKRSYCARLVQSESRDEGVLIGQLIEEETTKKFETYGSHLPLASMTLPLQAFRGLAESKIKLELDVSRFWQPLIEEAGLGLLFIWPGDLERVHMGDPKLPNLHNASLSAYRFLASRNPGMVAIHRKIAEIFDYEEGELRLNIPMLRIERHSGLVSSVAELDELIAVIPDDNKGQEDEDDDVDDARALWSPVVPRVVIDLVGEDMADEDSSAYETALED